MNEDKLMDWITVCIHNFESNRNNLDLAYDSAKCEYCYWEGALKILNILSNEIKSGKFNEYITIRKSKVELNKERLLSYFTLKDKDIDDKLSTSEDNFESLVYMIQLNLLNEIIDELNLKEGDTDNE